jgi:hypothetical protein
VQRRHRHAPACPPPLGVEQHLVAHAAERHDVCRASKREREGGRERERQTERHREREREREREEEREEDRNSSDL